MANEEESNTTISEETEPVEEQVPEESEESQEEGDTEVAEENAQEPQDSETEEMEAGANDASPNSDEVAPSPSAGASAVAVASKPAEEDRRSEAEKQPYVFEKCTVQIAIQLLPEDGDAQGRPVLLGVRTHLDAPILQVLRFSDLGNLPRPVGALVEQLKTELPVREQAARERLEKEKEERLKKQVKSQKPTSAPKPAKPEKPKTVQAAKGPGKSVLTANQRANAVNQAADAKQQLAMF